MFKCLQMNLHILARSSLSQSGNACIGILQDFRRPNKRHRFDDNQRVLAFLQVLNFNLFEVSMLFYYLGNIAFTKEFILGLNAICDDLKNTSLLWKQKSTCIFASAKLQLVWSFDVILCSRKYRQTQTCLQVWSSISARTKTHRFCENKRVLTFM